MTIEEFDETKFRKTTTAIHKGDRYTIKQVNFEERLIGLSTDYEIEIYWVRCENVTIEKDDSLFELMKAFPNKQ